MSHPGSATRRGQSSVIGVAVLVAVTALSVGGLTVAAGTFVSDSVAAANTQRVADSLGELGDRGSGTVRVEFSGGTLHVESRTVRLLRGGEPVETVAADTLVYEHRNRRVATLGGVLVEGRGNQSRLEGPLPMVADRSRLFVDVVALNASGPTAVGGSSPVAVAVRTNTTHEYRTHREGQYAVAVETKTPTAWERAFSERGFRLSRADFDEDGVPSVVVHAPEEATVDLAVHDVQVVFERG